MAACQNLWFTRVYNPNPPNLTKITNIKPVLAHECLAHPLADLKTRGFSTLPFGFIEFGAMDGQFPYEITTHKA